MARIELLRRGGSAAPPRPARSPEREALAAAIERHKAATAELKHVSEAKARFDSEVLWPGRDALEASNAALAALKANEGSILAAAYLGDAGKADELREAQRVAQEAAGNEARAEATWAGLEAREREAKSEFDAAVLALNWRHSEAVKSDPAMTALISRYETLKREFARFSLVMGETILFTPGGYRHDALRSYPDLSRDESNAWRAAIEAMRSDPDATLPAADPSRIERVIIDPAGPAA